MTVDSRQKKTTKRNKIQKHFILVSERLTTKLSAGVPYVIVNNRNNIIKIGQKMSWFLKLFNKMS